MNTIQNLEKRYATKKFDPSKKVSEADLEILKRAVQLSPTSYGLQLFKVVEVTDQEQKSKLRKHVWDQSQVTDAPHIFVFSGYKEVHDKHIDEYIELKSKAQGIPSENLKQYGDFMKMKINEKSKDETADWTARQTYIAATSLMLAAAELGLDTCPMEGFLVDQVNAFLKLPEQNLSAALIVAVGYHSAEDKTKGNPKVRKSVSDLFMTE